MKISAILILSFGLAAAELFAQDPIIDVPMPPPKVMKPGTRKNITELNSGKTGVKAVQMEFFGGCPELFGTSVISGKPVQVVSQNRIMVLKGRGIRNLKTTMFTNFTDGKFSRIYYLTGSGKTNGAYYYCKTKIKNLSRVRISIARNDPGRCRYVFSVIALINGKWVPITGKVTQTKWLSGFRNMPRKYDAFHCVDFHFAKGSVPEEIDGIGFFDESHTRRFNSPSYAQIEAK